MITKNYIKMCEQAKEIQDKWRVPFKNYIGDLYWKGKEYLMIPEACCFVTEIMFEPKDDFIYLPTQEQLLNMLLKWCQTNKILTNLLVGESINRYILKELYYYTDTFEGMLFVNDIKELTLSYIYKRMYHKVWTGKEWENVT